MTITCKEAARVISEGLDRELPVDDGARVYAKALPTTPTAGAALGTLDALHLASAMLWRERRSTDLIFATHDPQQARAARPRRTPGRVRPWRSRPPRRSR